MGDVDLWSLTEEGKSLSVNDLWLQHLQVRVQRHTGANVWGHVCGVACVWGPGKTPAGDTLWAGRQCSVAAP